MPFYGTAVWDPALIIAQIVAVQSLFYVSLGALLLVTLGGASPKLSLFYFFDYSAISVHSFMGWMVILAHLANAVVGAGAMSVVVERAKKCLDFTVTLYFLHLMFCWAYRGWPRSFEWWALNLVGLVIMAVLAEWLCLRKEMEAIPIVSGLGPASRQGPSVGAATRAAGVALTSLSGRLGGAGGSSARDHRDRDRDKDEQP